MKKDYLISTFAFGFNVLASLLFYFILGHYMDKIYFEEVTLIKRIGGTLVVFLFLGIGVSLTRQIALQSEKDSVQVYRYFLAAIYIISGSAIFFVLFYNFFSSFFAKTLFNAGGYQVLMLPMTIVVVVQLYSGAVFALFRGQLKIYHSSALTVLRALVPLLSLGLAGSAFAYLYVTALLLFLSTILVFFYAVQWTNFFRAFHGITLWKEIKELIYLGVPRMPGDFALDAMLTIPVTFTAHLNGTWTASMLSFSLAIITMSVAILSPISFILLPYSAKYIIENKHKEIRSHIGKLLGGSLLIITLTSIVVYFSAVQIGTLFLKDSYNELASKFLRFVVWSSIPYSIFLVLRSFIDAAYKKAINAKNVIIGLLTLLIVIGGFHYFTDATYPIIPGILIGFSVTAALTLHSYHSFFKSNNEI